MSGALYPMRCGLFAFDRESLMAGLRGKFATETETSEVVDLMLHAADEAFETIGRIAATGSTEEIQHNVVVGAMTAMIVIEAKLRERLGGMARRER
jgi:hypothetical protein